MPIILGEETGGDGALLDTVTKVCRLAMTWLGCEPESLNDVTSVDESSSKEDVLCYNVYNSARLMLLEERNWQFAIRDLSLSLAPGTSDANWSEIAISNITQAYPAVVTANNHNFSDGWHVKISDVDGMTEINDITVRVNNANNNSFQCYGLDTRKFTAYTGSGNAIRYEINPDYSNGYVYSVPTDYLRMLSTLPPGARYELIGSGDNRRILCLDSTFTIQYIADISTIDEMPEHFKRCWAARVAVELATPLQKKGSIRGDMWEWYQIVLNESDKSNARNVDPNHLVRETSPSWAAGGWSD